MDKKWEVCVYADSPSYQLFCKDFRTRWGASRYIGKILSRDEDFYCGTIWNEDSSQFFAYYWNGERIIPWDKPWVLSSRQARALEVDKRGRLID